MPQGWTELPPPPEIKQGAAFAWAGGELLYWGGVRAGDDSYAPTRDGYAFDPATEAWRSIPDAPLPGKYTREVWTGSETIFWGIDVDGREGGVAFDPATERWRVIPAVSPSARLGRGPRVDR
jgi:hypothetical protein